MSAFYSEFDPFAAAWLRELIKRGLIADGYVDERDLWDVTPADIAGFDQVHLCAGIGVWSYALRRAGWPDDRPVWTGSFPCQPFSAAGKGRGFADERHLWPAGYWLVEQCRPAVVFGEQVASKDAEPWLDLVQADMEIMGYAFGAIPFPSAGIGAPHIRDRLYWVADAADQRHERSWGARGRWAGLEDIGASGGLGHHHHQGLEGQRDGHSAASGRVGAAGSIAEAGELGRLADGNRGQRDGLAILRGVECDGPDIGRAEGSGEPKSCRHDGRVADPDGRNACAERQQHGREQRQQQEDSLLVGLADCDRARAKRRAGDAPEAARLPQAQRQPEHDADVPQRGGADHDRRGALRGDGLPGGAGGPGPTNGLWRDADWLFCRDGKWRPVEPGAFPLAHGAPARVGRLRGYGNAINAEAATAWIESYLETELQRIRLGVFG